jgi:acyl-CoA synthetase (AMP-forming)/AMP-acid ligase II
VAGMTGMTMGKVLRRVAARHAMREAIIFEGRRYTYGQFNDRVNQLARGFLDLGITKGDKIAIYSRNCNEYFEAYFACAKIGAVLVTLNFRLSAGEIEYMINQSDSRVLLVESLFQDFFLPLLPQINVQKETILVIDGEPLIKGGVAYEDFILHYSSEEVDDQEVGPDDPVLLLYTSGTTGLPKGAMLTQANYIWDSLSYYYHIDILWRDRLLMGMPCIHNSGLHIFTNINMVRGLPMVLMRTWDPGEACRLIQEERCTYACVLVPMLKSLLQYPDIGKYDLSSFRLLLTAAASYTKEFVSEAMYKLGVDTVLVGYGLTEASPVVSIVETTGETLGKENCLGWPIWTVDIRIVDEEDRDVAPGGIGELLVRGPNVFAGYYKMEDATAEVLRGGWLHTGDLVRRDGDGCLFFVERRKDMIKSGGENVYALEVEMALVKSNPELADVAVIGVPDAKWGERVVAYVVLKPGVCLSEEQVLVRSRPNLAGYKLPKNIYFVEEMPRSSSGKVKKFILRERT